MSDERIGNLQNNMQFLPRRLPKIVLRRVEEEFPIWREIVVSALCLCADQIIIVSYFEDLYGPNNKMFSRNLMLPFIFGGLISWNEASCVVSPVLLMCGSITCVVMTYLHTFLQRFAL